MEPNEKPKIDWTRLLTTAGIVLVTALVVGGTTWYAMDKSAKEIKTANDKAVSELQKEISDLKTKTTATTITTTTSPTTETVVSNTFNLLAVKAGDKVGTMTIISIKPFSMTLTPPRNEPLTASNANVVFTGPATVSGDYSYGYEAFGGGYDLVFNVSKVSYGSLPVIKGSEGHQLPIWFSNKAEAMRLLGITENVEKKGTASITINSYVINRFPSEVRDTFALVKVN